MSEDNLRVEGEDGIVTLTLAHAPANALDAVFLEEIETEIAALEQQKDWRALIITGVGSIFCAGVDLKKLPQLDVAGQDRLINALNKTYARLYALDRPVIAAINGHAIAGGMIMALCCDYRIAVHGAARFGLTEARVGVAFPVSALEIALAELRPDIAHNWLMFAETIDGPSALAQGALHELVTQRDLLSRAREKARDLAAIPQTGYAGVKVQVRERALARMRTAIENNAEPQLGGWLSDEARTAALDVLAGRK